MLGRILKRRRDRSGEAGFSLLEVLIVLTIIALVAALVGPRLLAQLDKSKVTAAKVQVRSLVSSLDTMHLQLGRYPTNQEGLDLLVHPPAGNAGGWDGPYLDAAVPLDPWGTAYVYQAPAREGGRPVVKSLGADGKPGGDGQAADITYGEEP